MLNTILASLSEGAPPVAPSSYESIATVTVGSGGASDITFSSIPSTYTHLQIRGIGRTSVATTDDNIYMQFNGDTGNNYANHLLYGSGSSVAAGGGSNQPLVYGARIPGASSISNTFGVGITDILDYANNNKYKTSRTLSGHDQNGSGFMFYFSGLWQSTSAITSIKLFVVPGTMPQYSQFALYGVKS